MNMLIVVLVLILVGGILYLNNDIGKKDQRKNHLSGLVKFLDARMEEISGRPNSFVLNFDYKGVSFVYEDIEDSIFERVMYRSFLRVRLPVEFNVVFSEGMKASFRPVSQTGAEESHGGQQIASPRGFQEFSIFSDKPELVRKLVADEAALRILVKFKNKDSRGKPEMAIDIIDGVLTLKFYPLGQSLQPTIFDLRNNISLIADYAEDLLLIYRQVKRLSEIC